MSGVCGLDINEMLIRAVWARIPRFELIVGDTGMHRSWFSRPLQPLPDVTVAYTDPDSSRLVALSRV
jgi:hypothetical protein